MSNRVTLYLAGPDVFEPDPVAIGEQLKSIARQYGFDPLFPFDNAIPKDDPNPSLTIFRANAAMIQAADIVVANLNPFRGAESDSGTVWEVGYALGLGKRAVGYIASEESMVKRVLGLEGREIPTIGPYLDKQGRSIEDFGHSLNLMLVHSIERLVIGGFEDALQYIASNRLEGEEA